MVGLRIAIVPGGSIHRRSSANVFQLKAACVMKSESGCYLHLMNDFALVVSWLNER